MHPTIRLLLVSVLVLSSAVSCERSQSVSPAGPQAKSKSERQELLDAVAEAERESHGIEAPEPEILLATPPGWTRSETRPLPPEDHGFSVAYEHESGLAVTLYQFTRGLTSISSDVNSPLVKEEMLRAKSGIEQAVQLGYYEAAQETENTIVRMGDSEKQARWSQYRLTVDGLTLASDIYVWAHANTPFKLRCTSRSEDAISNQAVLDPLLSALGRSSVAAGQ